MASIDIVPLLTVAEVTAIAEGTIIPEFTPVLLLTRFE
jgi:hypothetical protein